MKPTYLKADPCRCDVEEPFGDEREGTCSKCGRQVDGKPLPARGIFVLGTSDHSTFAKSTRKFRPAT